MRVKVVAKVLDGRKLVGFMVEDTLMCRAYMTTDEVKVLAIDGQGINIGYCKMSNAFKGKGCDLRRLKHIQAKEVDKWFKGSDMHENYRFIREGHVVNYMGRKAIVVQISIKGNTRLIYLDTDIIIDTHYNILVDKSKRIDSNIKDERFNRGKALVEELLKLPVIRVAPANKFKYMSVEVDGIDGKRVVNLYINKDNKIEMVHNNKVVYKNGTVGDIKAYIVYIAKTSTWGGVSGT